MGFFDFWTERSKQFVHGYVPEENVSSKLNFGTLEPGDSYLTVTLASARIKNSRVGFKKFHGSVNANVGALRADGAKVSFPQVIAPTAVADVQPNTLDRFVVSHQPLFGPFPYRGDAVQLNIGLVAVEVADMAGPYLEVLHSLASAAGVSFVAAAKPFAEPLLKGIDLMSGSATSLELYLVTNIPEPKPGVYVVARADPAEIPLDSLSVSEDWTLSTSARVELAEHPHMIIAIRGAETRNDWRSIPEIGASYEHLRTALSEDIPARTESAFEHFRRTVLLNDDLLSTHADRLIDEVTRLRETVDGDALTSGGGRAPVPELAQIYLFGEK